MSLESDLFERKRPDEEKLISYGFSKERSGYVYMKNLGKDGMQAEVHVSKTGHVSGKVMDTFSGDEYIAVHLKADQGSYTGAIRKLYLDVLQDIAVRCFHNVSFVSDQANRLEEEIRKRWKETGDHPFEKYPDHVAFRYSGNQKWYALVMEVNGEKIGMPSGNYEIVNLKSDHVSELVKQDGILPAWHMNHSQWISVLLNDTLNDKQLFRLTEASRNLIREKNSDQKEIHTWLIPANPKYYDLDHGFSVSEQLYWKQSSNVHVGDIVYLYYAQPYSSIRYRCLVTEVNIPDEETDGPVKIHRLMRIRRLYMYADGQLNRNLLKKFNVRAVRGPRSMPADLIAEIRKRYPDDTKEE